MAAPGHADADAVLGQLLPAFEGHEAPAWLRRRISAGQTHGATLFLRANTESAPQLAGLADALHGADQTGLPLLIGADQEGGQLVGLGHGTTRFPGAMALGAADDDGLTEEVGRATALELRALGITVCYAPVCDLALTPANVSLGTRAFGSDPAAVGRHVAAHVRGLMAGGVVATAKHFPGFGAVDTDPHHRLGVIEAEQDVLDARELVPFRAALDAGAGMVMSAHVALPAVTGDRGLPGTVSRAVMHGLLRENLGFGGVSITDAMDMKAVAQGSAGIVDSITALRAGVDLLLVTPDRAAQRRLEAGVRQAALRGLIAAGAIRASRARVMRLRRWLAGFERPSQEVVRSGAHEALAHRAAAAAVTLVRDARELLPLRPGPGERIAVVTPTPRDLTPADSSVDEPLALAAALRRHHGDVLDVRVAARPTATDIRAAREAVAGARLAVVATLATNVQPEQARLVEAVLATGTPTVTVAMRTPYDLADHPAAGTHLCTYSIVPASVEALADALFGRAPITGRLPVEIPRALSSGARDGGGIVALIGEIREQPEVAARLLRDAAPEVARICETIRAADPSHVVIAARGTSDHAAIYAQYAMGILAGLNVGLATPSVHSLYGASPDYGRALVIGISQSGASPDVVGVIRAARAQGALTLAITNTPGSDMAVAAEHHLDLRAGPERAVAATKTYTATLVVLAMLAAGLAKRPGADGTRAADGARAADELGRLPDALAAALDLEPDARRIAIDQASMDRCVVLGRGYHYATAREWSLKLKEMAYVLADPYSTADFIHGPLALIEAGFPIFAVAPRGATLADMDALVERLGEELRAHLLVVSDDPDVCARGTWALPLPSGLTEWLMPIVSIVPGQLHAMHLTMAKGRDPEQPRSIAKVTRTS